MKQGKKHGKVPLLDEIFKKARLVRSKAHAPYSRFKVGAAVKVVGLDTRCYVGCNVENASFGGTICAERSAIFSVVASRGKEGLELEYMVLVADMVPCVVPCGLCLQVIAEFAYPEFPIYLANLKGVQERVMLGDLLPRAFTSFEPK